MAALCKSSLGLQVGVMEAEIMDVNAELFETAIERLADLNSNSSTRPAEPRIKRLLEEAHTGRGTASISRAIVDVRKLLIGAAKSPNRLRQCSPSYA